MVRVRIKYLYEDIDRHGNVRLYIKPPGGRKTRVREEVGSPAFWEAYQLILSRQTPKPSSSIHVLQDSLRALVQAYQASQDFKALAPATQTQRRYLLASVCDSVIVRGDWKKERGDLPAAQMESAHVWELVDEWADKPHAARNRLKALSAAYEWGIKRKRVQLNPVRGVSVKIKQTEGFHTWTVEEVAQYRRKWPVGTMQRLAMELLVYTGARRSDVVTLGRAMVKNGWLRFRQAKTGEWVEIPVLPTLQNVLSKTPSEHMTFLVTTYGKAFSVAGFGNRFREWCDKAGLSHCSAHGLRKASATLAAEDGATEHELMAFYGWKNPAQARVYTQKANRKKMAERTGKIISLK